MTESSAWTYSMVQPSAGSTVAFVIIVAAVVVAGLTAVRVADQRAGERPLFGRAALAITTWLAITAAVSASGVLRSTALPPPVMGFFVASMVAAIWFARGRVGRRIAATAPLAALALFQSFRLPLELVLHQWYRQGVLPVQMTYEGHNFDILSGIGGLAVGLWLWRARPAPERARAVLRVYNWVGLTLLVVVATIAVTSTPTPLRQYAADPPVLLAMHFPYGWIVPFCVGAALAGHLITFSALRRS